MGHNRCVILNRWRSRSASRREKARTGDATVAAFDEFVATHAGVAAWVEDATGFNKVSLLLVAGTGEWLRRPVPSLDWGREYAAGAKLTCYTAGIDPYPQRMRDWDSAHRNRKED